MRFVEYILAGGIGGALGAIGLRHLNANGEAIDTLASGLLGYTSDTTVVMGAILIGLAGGVFTRSSVGAIVGGIAAPFAFTVSGVLF